MSHSESPARAQPRRAGLWKIAALRPVIVFLGGSYPERTVECCSDQPLPSLELVTHKTHKWPPNRSLSHTKQKGPHSLCIPTRGYILPQGKSGILGVHWGLAENDTSSAEGLISSVCVFFSLSVFTIIIFRTISTSHSCFPLSSSLPLELWGLIWGFGIVKLTEENAAMQMSRQVFQWMTDWKHKMTSISTRTLFDTGLLFSGSPL